jgi:hypothetical protein
MSTFSTVSKAAYIYDEATDTWHPIAAKANAAANYQWTGAHSFSGSVSMSQNLVTKAGNNNFQNAAARDAAITSPTNGLTAFLRQDDSGNVINSLQYYHNGVWRSIDDTLRLVSRSENYTLGFADGGKSINVSSSGPVNITIPLNSSVPFPIGQRIDIIRSGEGLVHIVPAGGVTINSREGKRYLSTQYSAGTITKVGTDSWILVGDLSSS